MAVIVPIMRQLNNVAMEMVFCKGSIGSVFLSSIERRSSFLSFTSKVLILMQFSSYEDFLSDPGNTKFLNSMSVAGLPQNQDLTLS